MGFNHNNYTKVDEEEATHHGIGGGTIAMHWKLRCQTSVLFVQMSSSQWTLSDQTLKNCEHISATTLSFSALFLFMDFINICYTMSFTYFFLICFPQLECKLYKGRDFLLLFSLLYH